ncbi:hypothetical protein [Ornithinibacillus halotolerans]|uniref:Uncharacterized protein n=1 Tax=Ornithinibacillus halotolerans TaxID=1274357 RepID=A0A916WAI0_9BACI|nr:hypothetical protein [Ornithinibacillus halotolerans]GGA81336.1 hypothetical protein GCM10008025_25860 [Ornithinibacillus halotolerans]
MKYLSHEKAINHVNNILGEDVSKEFEKQLSVAGEHGDRNFFVGNSKGKEIEVGVEWDKEADQLTYFIHE